jgi:hypothetical protein
MAPPSADFETAQPTFPTPSKVRTIPEIKKSVAGLTQSASFPTPLEYSGTLDHYESFDVTSVIGREFPKLQITDILNDDAKIRDLAITSKFYINSLLGLPDYIYSCASDNKKFVLIKIQSLNAESCSSGTRISTLSNRKSLARSLVSLRGSQRLPRQASRTPTGLLC